MHLAPTERQQSLRAELRAPFEAVLPGTGEPTASRALSGGVRADGRRRR